MKKLLSILIVAAMLLSMLASCELFPSTPSSTTGAQTTGGITTGGSTTATPTSTRETATTTGKKNETTATGTTTGGATGGVTTGGGNGGDDPVQYTYTDFTPAEKKTLTDFCGEVIPFAPNNGYYLQWFENNDGSKELNFFTLGNVELDFAYYLTLFEDYTFAETYESEGIIWYTYEKETYAVDLAFYTYNADTYIDVFVYLTAQSGGETGDHLYTEFTLVEQKVLGAFCGEVIPFVPNDEYYLEEFDNAGTTELNFYAFGNTQAEFDAYRATFTAYTFVESYEWEGITWYTYQKGDFYVDLTFYETEDASTCIDVYIYFLDDQGGGGSTGGDNTGDHLYTDFTDDEKKLFVEFCGEVIPFVPNDEYYLEEFDNAGTTELNFYAFGNTQAEFDAFRAAFTAYTFLESYVWEEITWYTYQKGDVYVDMAFYPVEDSTCIDVYIYLGSNVGGGGSGGSGGNVPDDVDLITNDGKGLPAGTNGVYNVDFKDAVNVKDVTDQGYYLDGCPTVGSPGVLVIPIDFTDAPAGGKYSLDVLSNAFYKDGETDYYSVYDYYYTSSYGQLTLDITVLDFWFRPAQASSYYEKQTMEYFGDQIAIGEQMIMDEALAYLATIMDLSAFDSDDNGTIDSVVLITTLDVGEDDFHWAYRFWNIYTDENDEYYEYDGVYANDFLWASYQFLHEGYDASGVWGYDKTDAVNTYTYIHEFGHILGADDYYDTAGYGDGPLGGFDVMASTLGDHNAYTKFNYGWLTTSVLVTTDTSVTLTLGEFSETGNTVILANNWDPTLGAYQEYYIVVYYKASGLNTGEGGYFAEDGILVYHVNASLYRETQGDTTYYDVYFNNTDSADSYGTVENLIEFVTHSGEYVYGVGDTLPTVYDDSNNALCYTFTVDAIADGTATVTFQKAA